MTDKDVIVKGYKATDDNMCCRGFQFEIGKWYEHEGDVVLCESGFHFCEHPSGPWFYYDKGRIFHIEAREVILSSGPGADRKHVARFIRLVSEIEIDGYGNTGDWNTGNRNTGDGNTGDGNTGDRNTGNGNTGDRNTGNGNTGNGNTGDWNTGNRNTGNRNTGDRNTGNGNQGNYHSGSLNYGEAVFYLFNKKADRNKVDFYLVRKLSELLISDEEIDPTPFFSLPNATKKAIKDLHNAHIEARRKK